MESAVSKRSDWLELIIRGQIGHSALQIVLAICRPRSWLIRSDGDHMEIGLGLARERCHLRY